MTQTELTSVSRAQSNIDAAIRDGWNCKCELCVCNRYTLRINPYKRREVYGEGRRLTDEEAKPVLKCHYCAVGDHGGPFVTGPEARSATHE